MKKIILLFLFISTYSIAQSYQVNKPIWDQYSSLVCTQSKNIVCKLDTCKTSNSNIAFELNFQTNELIYFSKYALKYRILDKYFHAKDPIYKNPVNTVSLNGFTIQLFNFEDKNLHGKPEFLSIQSQIGLTPKSESEIETITSFSKCYAK